MKRIYKYKVTLKSGVVKIVTSCLSTKEELYEYIQGGRYGVNFIKSKPDVIVEDQGFVETDNRWIAEFRIVEELPRITKSRPRKNKIQYKVSDLFKYRKVAQLTNALVETNFSFLESEESFKDALLKETYRENKRDKVAKIARSLRKAMPTLTIEETEHLVDTYRNLITRRKEKASLLENIDEKSRLFPLKQETYAYLLNKLFARKLKTIAIFSIGSENTYRDSRRNISLEDLFKYSFSTRIYSNNIKDSLKNEEKE